MEDFKVIDNYLMIRLPDEIDHHISVDISTRADRYIMTKKVGNVVFDFERTTFMDSSGIGIILGRYKKKPKWPRLWAATAAFSCASLAPSQWSGSW